MSFCESLSAASFTTATDPLTKAAVIGTIMKAPREALLKLLANKQALSTGAPPLLLRRRHAGHHTLEELNPTLSLATLREQVCTALNAVPPAELPRTLLAFAVELGLTEEEGPSPTNGGGRQGVYYEGRRIGTHDSSSSTADDSPIERPPGSNKRPRTGGLKAAADALLPAPTSPTRAILSIPGNHLWLEEAASPRRACPPPGASLDLPHDDDERMMWEAPAHAYSAAPSVFNDQALAARPAPRPTIRTSRRSYLDNRLPGRSYGTSGDRHATASFAEPPRAARRDCATSLDTLLHQHPSVGEGRYAAPLAQGDAQEESAEEGRDRDDDVVSSASSLLLPVLASVPTPPDMSALPLAAASSSSETSSAPQPEILFLSPVAVCFTVASADDLVGFVFHDYADDAPAGQEATSP